MLIKNIKHDSHILTPQKARIIARLMADDCLYKFKSNYTLKYEVSNEELLKQFEQDVLYVYGLRTKRYLNESGKKKGKLIPFVLVRSIKAYNDLLRYSSSYFSDKWIVPKEIFESSLEVKREFLRAFFDDEGSIVKLKGRPCYVILYSINLKGIGQISLLLKDFGINSRIKNGYGLGRNVFGLIVKDVKLFADSIGFYSKIKRNKLEHIFNNNL